MKIKTGLILIGVVSFLAGTTAAIRDLIEFSKQESAKREQIRIDGKLDIEAIQRASTIMEQRMAEPEYFAKGLAFIMNDLNNEIELQKIAIRME